MSRVGRRPIDIPSGIKVEIEGQKVKIEGKGKKLVHIIPRDFTVKVEDNKIVVARPSDSRINKALHGTTRSLLQNMIIGLNAGFEKKLQIQGVGYKAKMKGKSLVLDIGFSHSITYDPMEDIAIETPTPVELVVKGINKQKVGETAAEIRGFYPPEPYKGKGIRYADEYVRQKQGKSVV